MERKSKAEVLGAPTPFAGRPAKRPAKSDRGRLINAALHGEQAQEEPPTPTFFKVKELTYNPFNPRGERTEVQETADSLLERGQIQPVTVVSREAFLKAHPGAEALIGDTPYVVLDGNIRLEAARLAGLDKVRGDLNDELAETAEDMLESALVANIRRSAMSPLDEAKGLKIMVERHKSARAVARLAGKTHTWVNQRLALLNLTPELQEELERGDLAIEDARRVANLPTEEQRTALQAAARAREERNVQRRNGNGASTTPVSEPAVQTTDKETNSGTGASTRAPSQSDIFAGPSTEALASVSRQSGNGASTLTEGEAPQQVPEPRAPVRRPVPNTSASASTTTSAAPPLLQPESPDEDCTAVLKSGSAKANDVYAIADRLLERLSPEEVQILVKLLSRAGES